MLQLPEMLSFPFPQHLILAAATWSSWALPASRASSSVFSVTISQSKWPRGFLACWCLESSFSWDTCLTPADCPIVLLNVLSQPLCLHWLPAVLQSLKASWLNLSPSFYSPQLQQQLLLVLRHEPDGFPALPPSCPCQSEVSWLISSQFPQLSIFSITDPQQHFYETLRECFCFSSPHSWSCLSWCPGVLGVILYSTNFPCLSVYMCLSFWNNFGKFEADCFPSIQWWPYKHSFGLYMLLGFSYMSKCVKKI